MRSIRVGAIPSWTIRPGVEKILHLDAQVRAEKITNGLKDAFAFPGAGSM